MKKKVFICATAVALMAVAGYHGLTAGKSGQQPVMTELGMIEAVAHCEVSSNGDNNAGFCVRDLEDKNDVCVAGPGYSQVRCSGNI